MKTLNIIGAGRVGRTLGALWERTRVFSIQDVLSGTPHATRSGVAFIGKGRAVNALEDMHAADVWMLTPPDGRIAACCSALAASGLLREGDIVFHCSGALSSDELKSAVERGARTASVHPLKSFAEPHDAVRSFAGTYCAAEGDGAALAVLRPAFEQIGARVTEIDAQSKPLYHAASVIVCNYLVALMEAGLRCYETAGIARDTARAMMEPLVRETIDNVFKLGPVTALTGPIARGDDAVVAHQLAALAKWDPRIASLYRELAAVALDLAREKGEADLAALDRLRDLLHRND
ncbi:MAG: DUF2520 domain-containing protein [Betaproteobacteria bacterium]|nr:DUF2520 domain-containing protein [Betaproteobacteria bacterium]